MKTFSEWLETAPSFIQPNNDGERVKMETAYLAAHIGMADDTLVLMQQSMLRGVEAAS